MIRDTTRLIDGHKLFSKKWFIDILFALIGSFIVASAYVFFISPFKIIPGGVYGLSIIILYLSQNIFAFIPNGLPIGLTALAFNIPLVYLAYRFLGKESIVKQLSLLSPLLRLSICSLFFMVTNPLLRVISCSLVFMEVLSWELE